MKVLLLKVVLCCHRHPTSVGFLGVSWSLIPAELALLPGLAAASTDPGRQMGSFLEEILELSEQDESDPSTWMEQPPADAFKVVLPSANVGLPGHLIQIQRPGPAYVTHTGPLVRRLLEQDQQRKAPSRPPAQTEPNKEPPGGGPEEDPQELSGGSSPGSGKGSVGTPPAQSPLTSQSVYSRVIFARRPPSRVLPWSSLLCASRKE
ncbi:CMT1A duplicated region transcript 4 protein homolog [Empidonax traillii]|uniref:CMT1A duplicated region transcript 4 protein homolog n=1 Tax=Empidonax traillii TaxID=164674 RepID=UPI000FFD9CFF|nr:CMT1A duplicated region transcript 4 protein homolog [Empidonax traillii]